MPKPEPKPPIDILSAIVVGPVALPRPVRRAEPSPPVARTPLSPKVDARTHGRRSLTIGGKADAGDAFAAWLRSAKGLDPDQRLPAGQLGALAIEFKARPIMGHRRTGTAGDNHRANPEDIRK